METPSGVLLANVGSPDAPDPQSVGRFLREFLSDPDVVPLPRVVWLPLLYGVVVPLRSRSSARLYESIWTAEGSPLRVHSLRQRDALQARLGSAFQVALGMRYGEPSIRAALDELARSGCRKVVVLPLFPQESFSTSGSVHARAAELAGTRFELIPVGSFAEHAGYLDALTDRVRAATGREQVDHHVFSFHGLPQKSVERGDPYRDQCAATAQALARRLELADGAWTLAFQSRFGPRWLEPNTATVVQTLARARARVLVATPGFAADCLETLEEIGIRLRESVARAGGVEPIVVPALNDHPVWIEALARLVRERAAARSPSSHRGM